MEEVGVPLAKKLAGTVRTTELDTPQVAAGMFAEVVKAKTADCAVLAILLAKGMVMDTSVMVPWMVPTVPDAEHAVV